MAWVMAGVVVGDSNKQQGLGPADVPSSGAASLWPEVGTLQDTPKKERTINERNVAIGIVVKGIIFAAVAPLLEWAGHAAAI